MTLKNRRNTDNRRKGVTAIAAILLCVSLSGAMAACNTAPDGDVSFPLNSEPSSIGETLHDSNASMFSAPSNDQPSNEPSSDQKKEPLKLGERIIEKASFDQIVERFGKYKDYSVRFEGVGTNMYEIEIHYDTITVILYTGLASSVNSTDPEAASWEEVKSLPLSSEDKERVCPVRRIKWSDPGLEGPRGIKVGDSEEQVRSQFLSKPDENDGSIIYRLSDVDPFYPDKLDEETYYSGAYIQENMDMSMQDEYEYSLVYIANVPPDWTAAEWTHFNIKDAKVVSIEQGYWTIEETP